MCYISIFEKLVIRNKENFFLLSENDWGHIGKVEFWVEGIFQCIVAVSGLLGNIISAFILLK